MSISTLGTTDNSEFEEAAGVPVDDAIIQLLKSKKVVNRLEKQTNKHINHKLLTTKGLKGFVTLVHWALKRDDWLTVEQAIDHVIEVTSDKYRRLRSNNADAWINGWALVGIELDVNDPPYRKGLPAWRDHFRRLAATWDLEQHLGSELFLDRDGLRELLNVVNWDKFEAEKTLKNGLLSLQAESARKAGSVWSARRWSFFSDMNEIAVKRDTLHAHLPDGKVGNAITQMAWNDLEAFEAFVKTAGSLNKATHAFINGVQSLQTSNCHATCWSYFEQHL